MSDDEHETFENKPSPRRNGLLMHVAGLLEFLFAFVGYWLGRAIEASEWVGIHFFEIFCLLVMPWRWFKKKEPVVTTADDEDLAPVGISKEPTTILDTSEHFGGHLFALIGLCFVTAFRWLLPQKLIDATQVAEIAVTETTIGFLARFGQGCVVIVERVFPRRYFWPIYWLFGAFVGCLFTWADFAAQWWYSRNFAKLLWASPAILLIAMSTTALIQGTRYSDQKKIWHYQQALEKAEKNDDNESVELVRTKLTQLGFEHGDVVDFNSALKLAEAGDIQAARTTMEALAPVDEPGFANAHLWLASTILEQTIKVDGDPLDLVELHTNHALELAPGALLGLRLRAEILLQRGELDESIKIMKTITRQYPDLHAILSHLYNRKGDLENTRYHAIRAVGEFEALQEKKKKSPDEVLAIDQLTALGYLRLAEAHGIANRHRDANKLLQQGIDKFPENGPLKNALLQSLVTSIGTNSLQAEETRAEVETFCKLAPGHAFIVAILVRGVLANDPSAVSLIEELKSKELLSSDVHERLGDAYLTLKRFPDSIQHYERTLEMNPKASFAWNNMAWIWGSQEPLDLKKAIAAADQAIKLSPDARFFETRGQINLKLQRWEQAAKDLERALNGTIPNADKVHRSLAICYEKLGKSEQAEAHRVLATTPDHTAT